MKTVAPAERPDLVYAEPGSEVPLWPELDGTRPVPSPALAAKGLARTTDGVFARAADPAAVTPDLNGANARKHHQRTSNLDREFPAEILTPEEVAAIIGRCSVTSTVGIRDRALLTLLYRSGLRVSEVLALRVVDVDMANHSLRLLKTKAGKAQTRGYHPGADDALARWLDLRRPLGKGPLFCTLRGGGPPRRIWPQQVRNLLHRLGAQAGIERRVHPHGWRHTFAVELDREGVPITVISELLGHSSVGVTARYLRHLTNRQAIDTLQTVNLPSLGESR